MLTMFIAVVTVATFSASAEPRVETIYAPKVFASLEACVLGVRDLQQALPDNMAVLDKGCMRVKLPGRVL